MSVKNNVQNLDDVFDNNYLKIRDCLKGLEEILNINFLERNIYRQLAQENLEALHSNIIDLLKHTYTPRKVRMKLREIEYEELEAQ